MSCFIIQPARSKVQNAIADVSMQQSRVQESRLFAALLESGWGLKVNEPQAQSLKGIHRFFSISISELGGEKTCSVPIKIDHSKPATRFGHVERPLIFPTWLAGVGAAGGSNARDFLVTFRGFPSRERVRCTIDFLERNLGPMSALNKKLISLINQLSFSELRTKALNYLFFQSCHRKRCAISWSADGRQLANKVVDEAYWKTLHRSFIVYCPNGDFGWTYRFYEAMLAGALPLLEGQSKSNAFAVAFNSLTSIQEAASMSPQKIQECVDHNRNVANKLLTAMDNLRPECFL